MTRKEIFQISSRLKHGTVESVTRRACLAVQTETTVAQALDKARLIAEARQSINTPATLFLVYVVDAGQRLVGTVSLRELQQADADRRVTELMCANPVYTRAHRPREKAGVVLPYLTRTSNDRLASAPSTLTRLPTSSNIGTEMVKQKSSVADER